MEEKKEGHVHVIEEEKLIEERKRKIKDYLSNKWSFIVLILLSIFAIWVRTLNISRLRDITTGGWTLGPDLDPFLFLRWAKYIIQHGSIMLIDKMRYVPVGFQTKGEVLLHPYLIAWFHKFASAMGFSSSFSLSINCIRGSLPNRSYPVGMAASAYFRISWATATGNI